MGDDGWLLSHQHEYVCSSPVSVAETLTLLQEEKNHMVSHLSTIPQGPVKERVSAARGTRQRLASILQDSQRTRGFHRPSSRCNSTIDLASLDAQSNALYGNDQRHSGSYGTYGTYGYDSEVAFHSQEPPDLFLDDCTPDIANELPLQSWAERIMKASLLASPSHPKGTSLAATQSSTC